MIMERFSQRERRMIAVGILVFVMSSIVFGILRPYTARYELYRDAIDDQLFRLSRLHSAAAQLPSLQRQLLELREHNQTTRYLLEPTTPALAAAQIQQMVAQMVADGGGDIVSMQAGRAIVEDGFARVSVRVRMNADSDIMAELFSAIESRRPLMFINDVSITATRQRRRSRSPVAESGQISLEFEVYGYMPETRN